MLMTQRIKHNQQNSKLSVIGPKIRRNTKDGNKLGFGVLFWCIIFTVPQNLIPTDDSILCGNQQ